MWKWFWQLERSRQGGFGAQSFTYQEIEAFARLMQVEIRPWEVSALILLDDARRAVWAEAKSPAKPSSPAIRGLVSVNDSAAIEKLFDGMGRRTM